MRDTSFACMLLLTATGVATAQSGSCLDVGDEPHHKLVFQNADARVYLLELPRLASTISHCHSHPYVYIVAGSGTTSNTVEGRGTMSHDWSTSETRVVYTPMQHVIRNESLNTHRELVIELLHNVSYDPLSGSYENDLFPSDLGSARPTWTVSFSLGAMTASKNQLAPGRNSPSPMLLVCYSPLAIWNCGSRPRVGLTNFCKLQQKRPLFCPAAPASLL
jgi:hypothetical protein